MPTDPNWPTAAEWLAGRAREGDAVRRLAVLGAPVRLGSLSGGRFDLAPEAVRRGLHRLSTYDVETGYDVRRVAVRDDGDLDLADARPEEALPPLAEAVGASVDRADALVILGGDNSITRPGVRGLGGDLRGVGLLTLDAHLDLRDTAGGLSNGNPIRALLEDGLPGENVFQVGIQAFANSGAYARDATAAGITVITAETARARGVEAVVAGALEHLAERLDRIYVDLDLDVLDRAFAPASPGSRPGGLAPADLQAAARRCGGHPKVRALDLVEVDPERDVADVTVLTAASAVVAFASGLVARG
ncbi:MAG: arginase family protein [Actinomycetota bacterium]